MVNPRLEPRENGLEGALPFWMQDPTKSDPPTGTGGGGLTEPESDPPTGTGGGGSTPEEEEPDTAAPSDPPTGTGGGGSSS